jgi:hypothetical protein
MTMNANRMLLISAITALMVAGPASHAGTISFSGYTWAVRPSGKGGPGPNYWDQNNVSVDTNGYLHLRLTQRGDRWYSSEVYTQNRLGFGRYEFWLIGRVDKLDRNVVLGLFNYPTSDVGPDGTHEIDIEFAQWGDASAPIGNYTVWPTTTSVRRESKPFPFTLIGDASKHSFTWSPTNVFFQSLQVRSDNSSHPFASWPYQPPNPATGVSQKSMPVHLNLWCFKGLPPSNGQQVELIVRAFKFTPM